MLNNLFGRKKNRISNLIQFKCFQLVCTRIIKVEYSCKIFSAPREKRQRKCQHLWSHENNVTNFCWKEHTKEIVSCSLCVNREYDFKKCLHELVWLVVSSYVRKFYNRLCSIAKPLFWTRDKLELIRAFLTHRDETNFLKRLHLRQLAQTNRQRFDRSLVDGTIAIDKQRPRRPVIPRAANVSVVLFEDENEHTYLRALAAVWWWSWCIAQTEERKCACFALLGALLVPVNFQLLWLWLLCLACFCAYLNRQWGNGTNTRSAMPNNSKKKSRK